MTSPVAMLSSIDLLEKEFDRSFVDIDLMISETEDFDENDEFVEAIRNKMSSLSSCFSQLCYKAQTTSQTNTKLEALVLNYRTDLIEAKAEMEAVKSESEVLLRQVHALQLQIQSGNKNNTTNHEDITKKMEKDLASFKADIKKQASLEHTSAQYKKENKELTKQIDILEKELFGARLASKYLDKELAGRIQQIQLLGRNIQSKHFEKMWSQLEAEIHLHRHKTVIKACRGNQSLPTPSNGSNSNLHGVGEVRRIVINKPSDEGLGISITGGRDHGVPILVSEIHSGAVVDRTGGLYVGDAILSINGVSLRDAKHEEAVKILSDQVDTMVLEAVYVTPEDDVSNNTSSSQNKDRSNSVTNGNLENDNLSNVNEVRN